MKNHSILKQSLFTLALLLAFNVHINAQVCGDVTLSTQAQVNALTCTSITGNLIIDDGNTGSITDLDPIYVNGLRNATVSGSVIIRNCPNLPDIYGLDGINTIGGSLTIQNCASMSTLHRFGGSMSINTIGEFLILRDLPNLTNLSAFTSITSVGTGIAIYGQQGANDFTGFDNVSFSPVVEIYQTNIQSVNGFNKLTSIGWFQIFDNNSLTSFSGFNSLQSIKQTNSLNGSSWNLYNVASNDKLSSFTAHSNLSSTAQLRVTDNPQLSDCCYLLDLINQNPSPLTISGNAFGCSSVAEIDGPPSISACPSNATVSTGASNCTASTSIQGPSASDNCDYEGMNLRVDLANGSVETINNIANNATVNYNLLPQGVSTVTYTARDQNNNMSSCSFTITVEDTEAPIISNVPADVTIGCDEDFPAAPNILVTDNCDPAPSVFGTGSVSTGPCGQGEIVEIQTFVYDAFDASGNSTQATWTVTRLSDFSFNLGPDVQVCEGGSYIIDPFITGGTYQWSTGATTQALSVNSSGNYSLTLTTANGCCFVDDINITIGNPPTATATGATLDCGANSVQITGESSVPGASFEWTGPGGFTSNEQNPDVSGVGDYTLTITTPEGCTASDVATVVGDNDVPDASAMGGSINCEVTTAQLNASSTTPDVSYSWSGPDGFMSNDQNPIVNTPGLYILTVTGSNGCSITADAEIIGDTIPPSVELADSVLTCINSEIVYEVDGSAIWSGPDGFASLADSVTLSLPGTYSVTVTAENSCTSVASFELLGDFSAPDISATGGVISCALGQDTLKASSETPGASFLWTGPDSFSTTIQNPIAATIGTYTLTVTAPNGCTSTQDVELSASLDAPQVTSSSGTIDCINTSLDLFATSDDENVEFMWFGPNGFTATGDSIQVSVPGFYTVNATNEDGCVGTSTSDVIGNIGVPEVQISASNLNCLQGASQFSTEVSEDVVSYLWTGPNDFNSTEKEPQVTVEGLYILEVTAQNGCTNTDSLELISDVQAPSAIAEGGMLTCTENTIEIMGSTDTPNATFSWEGPENFTSSLLNPVVSIPGSYIFTVTAPNGCIAIDSAIVSGDPDLPIVSASGGVIDCNNFEVQLIGSSTSEGASVRWDGPNGYVSFSETPIVDLPGDYTFTVTSSGDCIAFTSVAVTLDTRDPNLTVAEGFLDCENGVREFDALTNATDGVFEWSGPDGFTSDVQNPVYTKAGIYMVTVTASNGCSTTGAIEVEEDIPYEANLIINGSDATVEIIGGTNPFTIIFDDNVEGPTAMGLTDGDHFVRITDGLGCEEIIEFTIMSSSVVDEEDLTNVNVFPNPAQDLLNIDLEASEIQLDRLSVLNSSGQIQTIREVHSKYIQLNIEELPAGIYYLKLEGQEQLVFKKFLKI